MRTQHTRLALRKQSGVQPLQDLLVRTFYIVKGCKLTVLKHKEKNEPRRGVLSVSFATMLLA